MLGSSGSRRLSVSSWSALACESCVGFGSSGSRCESDQRADYSYIILAAILNYIVDGYGHYSASALGAVVFIRNIVSGRMCRLGGNTDGQAGAGFPLCPSEPSHIAVAES